MFVLSGMVEVHLHEIIQAMMVIDVLPISLNNKQVADLYLEFAFMYGALGFHYSTQVRWDSDTVPDYQIHLPVSEHHISRCTLVDILVIYIGLHGSF